MVNGRRRLDVEAADVALAATLTNSVQSTLYFTHEYDTSSPYFTWILLKKSRLPFRGTVSERLPNELSPSYFCLFFCRIPHLFADGAPRDGPHGLLGQGARSGGRPAMFTQQTKTKSVHTGGRGVPKTVVHQAK